MASLLNHIMEDGEKESEVSIRMHVVAFFGTIGTPGHRSDARMIELRSIDLVEVPVDGSESYRVIERGLESAGDSVG